MYRYRYCLYNMIHHPRVVGDTCAIPVHYMWNNGSHECVLFMNSSIRSIDLVVISGAVLPIVCINLSSSSLSAYLHVHTCSYGDAGGGGVSSDRYVTGLKIAFNIVSHLKDHTVLSHAGTHVALMKVPRQLECHVTEETHEKTPDPPKKCMVSYWGHNCIFNASYS